AVECVRLEPETFTANDWGNLVFIRQDLFEAAGADLRAWILSHEDRFHGSARIPVVHHPGYGIAFRKWLGAQLAGFSRGPERSVALDVGAHEGAFTRACLETVLVSKAIVFEPHPGNAERLRQSFAGAPVTVEEMAVAACGGTGNFLYGDDTATGSLLAAIGAEKNAVRSRTVPITSLDGYAAAHGLLEKVALLKIDTQATDLRVLEGAESLLRESQPIVVVEMIFAPLYENQDDPADLMLWLTRRGYRLAGFFDEHFSREGWLAWCDACFLPVGRMPGYQPPFTIRESCPEEAVAETGVACEAAARKRRGLGGLLHRLFTNHS
ncbi:MAG: FkbM family methyltransferase, partial [Planctomycetota bacterium]